ncbi:MAG: CaiB/BaiF CoA-transferase family protein [Actinomycetota bacterium]
MRPLEGLRVLDLSRVLSGPYVGRMLSDLGADVVKVEPPEGDVTRNWGEERAGLSGFYTQQNAGKRNISVDLKRDGGPELVAELAERADVLIENFRPGVLARFGLSWADLSPRNPRLVMLSITGFGQDGPEAGRQAYAPVLHAESGVLARQARFNELSTTDVVLSVADTNAALHGLVGVLAALQLRERTGVGQHVDLAMLDAMLATDDYVHHAMDDSPIEKLGGQVFDTASGAVLISSEPKYLWAQLRSVHGLVDPTPDGADLATKIACRRTAIAEWVSGFADVTSLGPALEAANLAFAPVREPERVLDSPTVRHRGIAATVDDRQGGTRQVVQSPYRFSDAASGVRGGAPHRGEHNAEVLEDWLDLDGAAVDDLSGRGVLGADDRAGGPWPR